MQREERIALLCAQDERGMDALLLHDGPMMRYIIAAILPDPRDREDCLMETAMQVWQKAAQFDPSRGSWNAWLTALTRNAALNFARRAANGAQPLAQEASVQTPEEALLQSERRDALARALRQLDSDARALFYRKYYYRQSTAQIAAETGMTERAVEGRLYRLKKQLRKLLGGDAHG